MAKSKKKDNAEPKDDTLMMDVMPGADVVSEEEAKPFDVDLNFEEDAPEEEAQDEKVEQEVDATPEKEAVAEEPKPETKEEENVEPEATSEEGVDENSEADAQPDIQPVEGSEKSSDGQDKVKAPMVPKSRLDEVLAKNKAMQKKLEEATAAEKAAAENAPEYDFDAKEAQYQDHVLNGETEEATSLRNEIRNAEKDQFMFEVQAKMGQTVQENQELSELHVKAAEIEQSFPFLSENSPDFDADLQNEVVELRNAFITQGYTPADALGKATEYTLAVKKPEALGSAPKPDTKAPDPAQTKQQEANVSKKLKAAEAQPPAMKGESKTEKKIDLSVLSSEEFDALPAETLRRMRGDFG